MKTIPSLGTESLVKSFQGNSTFSSKPQTDLKRLTNYYPNDISGRNFTNIFKFIIKCDTVNRLNLLEGFEESKARESLNLLLRDRKNEFKELADSIKIPLTSEDWEVIVLKFCFDFVECFTIWSSSESPTPAQTQKCMTIMREVAQGKKTVTEISHIQNIAYNLCKEFKNIYRRTK